MQILCGADLQPEWRGMNNEYGGSLSYIDNLDATFYIPCGSMIKTADGRCERQHSMRGLPGGIYPVIKDIPKKRRGRPAKADSMSNAQRQAKLRADRKAKGLCPCCGQQMPLFD